MISAQNPSWILLAVVIWSTVGCHNYWLRWGNPDSRYGEAHNHRYGAEPGTGLLKLTLYCQGEYPDDPSVSFELSGDGKLSYKETTIILTWDDQNPVQQEWKIKHQFTTTWRDEPSAWYWVYPPNSDARRDFLSRLSRSEHLVMELVGPFSDYVDVRQGHFKTKGTVRVLQDLAKICAGEQP